MPGIKDCVTITDKDGNKTKCSKMLILCHLKEAHSMFKENFPNYNVCFLNSPNYGQCTAF